MDKKMTFVVGGFLFAGSFWLKDWVQSLADSSKELGLPFYFISLVYLLILISGLKLVADSLMQ